MRLRKRKSPRFLFPVQMAASGDGRREVISEALSLSHQRAWETEPLQGGDGLQPVSNTFIQAVGETNPPLTASPPTAPYLALFNLIQNLFDVNMSGLHSKPALCFTFYQDHSQVPPRSCCSDKISQPGKGFFFLFWQQFLVFIVIKTSEISACDLELSCRDL